MAYLIELVNFRDNRGNLTVLDNAERLLPFKIKRVFYIYQIDNSVRGGHRHRETIQAAICIKGSCVVSNNEGGDESAEAELTVACYYDIPGDLNNDCIVDLNDFAILANHWLDDSSQQQ